MVLEKPVHQQLYDFHFLESIMKLSIWILKKRLIELVTATLIDDIRKEVGKGNLVGTAFLELSRAIDAVSHGTLLKKLSTYGVNNHELEWFKVYLFLSTQQIERARSLVDRSPG